MVENLSLEEYKKAYREVVKEESRRFFFTHLILYILVNMMLIVINLTNSPQEIWFIYPLFGWGIGLVFHFIFGYLLVEKRLFEREAKAEYIAKQLKERKS